MFQPSNYAVWWYPWFFSLLFCTFYIKNFHARDRTHPPLKPIYYSSGHNDTNSHYFRSQFGDLCQKLSLAVYSNRILFLKATIVTVHNEQTCRWLIVIVKVAFTPSLTHYILSPAWPTLLTCISRVVSSVVSISFLITFQFHLHFIRIISSSRSSNPPTFPFAGAFDIISWRTEEVIGRED